MHILKKSILASAIAASSAVAVAEVSMTVGMVSDYVYRGTSLGDAGAYGSIDYASGGFYAGIWAISDSYGLATPGTPTPVGAATEGTVSALGGESSIEYDLYLGYDTEVAGVGVSVGYVAYEYTYGDGAEEEYTLGLSYGPVSVGYADGELADGTDYDYTTLSADVGAFSFTYGEDGEDYDWSEISTGTEVGAVSIGFTVGGNSLGEDYMVLDVSTGIEL